MKKITYHINCDCSSYNWTRRPKKGLFIRCKGCGKLLGDMEVSVVEHVVEQRCGNCTFYDPKCKWCDKRGAGYINAHIYQGRPTTEYPCNKRRLTPQDGESCREHSCRINGRWLHCKEK